MSVLSSTTNRRASVSRRRFVLSLGIFVGGASLIVACGPSSAPSTAPPATQPPLSTAAAAPPKPTSAPPAPATAAPAQATPAGIGNKQIRIEWWRRNYTPGSQSAETITSDAAVKG